MTGADADAADAAQEALIAIVRGLPASTAGPPSATWAYRDRHQRLPRRAAPAGPAAPNPACPRSSARPAAALPRPTSQSATASISTPPWRALSPEFRLVVTLRDQLGLDYAEIAEVAGIPPGTVRSRLSRARATLADRLDPTGRSGGNRGRSGQRRRVRAMTTSPPPPDDEIVSAHLDGEADARRGGRRRRQRAGAGPARASSAPSGPGWASRSSPRRVPATPPWPPPSPCSTGRWPRPPEPAPPVTVRSAISPPGGAGTSGSPPCSAPSPRCSPCSSSPAWS